MRLFLAEWIGDGTEENAYRPRVDADAWAAIDLRPDPTVLEGRVLVATPGDAETSGDVLSLGDDPDARTRTPSIRAIEARLGLTLTESTMRGIIAELLIMHGTPPHDRTRWNTLKANHLGRHRIVMLGETLYDAPVVQGAVITDDFNRSDGAIGPNWSGQTDGYLIDANQAELQTSNAERIYYSASALDGDDNYTQVDLTSEGGGSSRGLGCTCRTATNGADTYYEIVNRRGSSALWIRSVVTGTETTIASKTLLPDLPATLKIEADGSTITAYVDDVEELSTTNMAITTGATGGLRAFGASLARLDDFEAGDLSAGTNATVTPAAIATTVALPAASPSGDANTTPPAIASTVALPAATVTGGATTEPATITATVALPATTVTGDATATPATITTVAALPAATASTAGNATVTPAAIAVTTAIVQAVASASSTVTPAVIATTVALPAVDLSTGSTVTPGTIVTAFALPAPSLVGDGVATPGVIAVVVTIPTPTAGDIITADIVVVVSPPTTHWATSPPETHWATEGPRIT